LTNLEALYKFHRKKVIFSDAISTCAAEDAQVFWPESLVESEAVVNMIDDESVKQIWLGITRTSASYDGYKTLDGMRRL
jgi:hypothetical protein